MRIVVMITGSGRSGSDEPSGHEASPSAGKPSSQSRVPNAVQLDLTRDLPEVRRLFAKVSSAQRMGACQYTAPCVVGAMVPAKRRADLDVAQTDEWGDTTIGKLISHGFVSVPSNQKRAFVALQRAFDSGDQSRFQRALKRAEKKWLSKATGLNADCGQTPVGVE